MSGAMTFADWMLQPATSTDLRGHLEDKLRAAWDAGVAAERERCIEIALAGCNGTSPKYAEACRSIAALITESGR